MTIALEVKLEPHVGTQYTKFGPVEIELDQYRVMCQTEFTGYQWVHIGYICKPKPGNLTPPLNGLDSFRVLPQSLKDEITAKVGALLSLSHIRATEPAEPVEVQEEVEEVYEDEG